MGSQSFETTVTIPRKLGNDEAFHTARESAAHESGHGGYTGTMAEKSSFVLIHHAGSKEAGQRIVKALMNENHNGIPIYRKEIHDLVDDKWGPACAVRYPHDDKNDRMIFFGWASS